MGVRGEGDLAVRCDQEQGPWSEGLGMCGDLEMCGDWDSGVWRGGVECYEYG